MSELQSELAHVSRLNELGQLVAALVHEVNQPLAAISSYAGGLQQLAAKADNEMFLRAANEISDQVTRADTIIRRLRDFVRKSAPTMGEVPLGEMVDEAIGLASIDPDAKRVPIEIDVHDAEARVMADRIQIQQVMFNLIRNGLEATAGLPNRALKVATAPKGDAAIEISVTDNGPGLTQDVLRDLFTPFKTTKPNGMGIGLSICRTIVEGHGGELSGDSAPGGGATFKFTLLGRGDSHGHVLPGALS